MPDEMSEKNVAQLEEYVKKKFLELFDGKKDRAANFVMGATQWGHNASVAFVDKILDDTLSPTPLEVELALYDMLDSVKEHDIPGIAGVSQERAAEIWKVYQYVAKVHNIGG